MIYGSKNLLQRHLLATCMLLCLQVPVFAQFGLDLFAKDDSPSQEQQSKAVVDKAAFDELKESVSPMSKNQIKEIKRLWSESVRATTIQVDSTPKPMNSSMRVSLENGAQPAIIRLSAGVVSVVSFFDASGQPWPIRGYNIGNPSIVNIVWNEATPEEEASGNGYSNTLMMQAQSLYKTTNMVVLLRGLTTPVLVELVPGQKEVDYRLDIQVPRAGPLAQTNYKQMSIPKHNQDVLMDILNNIAPNKSTKLHIHGGEAQAWLLKKKLYVRTNLEVISPAWTNRVNGANNEMHVYELPYTSAVVALKNGKVVKLQIEGA